MTRKPTPSQLRMLRAMVEHDVTFVSYYGGGRGQETRGLGYYWRMKDSSKMPKPHTHCVESATRRDYLRDVGDNDFEMTELGRYVAIMGREPTDEARE